jgi:hypothetical protein
MAPAPCRCSMSSPPGTWRPRGVDAGYGDNAQLRAERYVMQVKGAVTAHAAKTEPETIAYSSLSPRSGA